MDLFLSVHLQKQYLLITLLINLLILFKWTLLERSLGSLLRSLVIKSLIDNIFVERLGFTVPPISSFIPKKPNLIFSNLVQGLVHSTIMKAFGKKRCVFLCVSALNLTALCFYIPWIFQVPLDTYMHLHRYLKLFFPSLHLHRDQLFQLQKIRDQ